MTPWRRGKRDDEDDAAQPARGGHPFLPVSAVQTNDANTGFHPVSSTSIDIRVDEAMTVTADPADEVAEARGTEDEVSEPEGYEPEALEDGLADDEAAEYRYDDAGSGDDATEIFEPLPGAPAEPISDDLPTTDKRSGRNMLAATTVGLGLLGIVLTSAWFHPLALAVVLYGFCIGAVIEWRRALDKRGRQISLVPILAATAGMAVATWFGLAEGLAVALLVGCAGVVAWRVVDERIENTLADSLASMLTLMWIPFLASFFMLMVLAEDGWQRVFILVVAVVGNDSGGLYAGMSFGKTPFAPRISPKKTWEGAIGGVVLGAGAATVLAYFLMDGRWWLGAIVGIAVAAAATAGDLAESAIKRDMHVKDMSHAIPGHGGIMDRLDSALVAAPVAYVIFAIALGTT